MRQLVIGFALQFVLFIPFYIIWRNNCKTIGRDNLAVSLGTRFVAWLCFVPIWLVVLLK